MSDCKKERFFTDAEYRILLSALSRERKICEKVDKKSSNGKNLVPIINSIDRKITKLQCNK